MPEYITGRPFFIKTLLENTLEQAGIIKLIHDGSGSNSAFYTRQYQFYKDGKPTNITLKFIYDKRNDRADITMSYYNIMNLKFLQKLPNIPHT